MTAQQLIAYDECLKEGVKFVKRCGATYEIAIKAFQQLAAKEKERNDAQKKEDDRLMAIAKETRARQERDALRQKQIHELQKRKNEIERLQAEADKRKLEIVRLAEDTDRDLYNLMNEEQMENANETNSIREDGQKIRAANEKKLLLKRENNAIRAAQSSLEKLK